MTRFSRLCTHRFAATAFVIGLLAELSPAAFAAAQPAPAAAKASTSEDDRIEDLVRVRLAGNRDTGGEGRIKVTVKSGVVTLTGMVESERAKAAAEKQTKKVKGVKSVVNQLTLAPRA